MLETLNRKNIPFDELVLFSSARSAGKEVEFQGKTYTVQELTDARASEHFDYVLMSAGGGTSEHFAHSLKRWCNRYRQFKSMAYGRRYRFNRSGSQ